MISPDTKSNRKVHHFSAVPLADPRPLNHEEKGRAFKEQLLHWSEQKQKLVSALEHALSEMKDTLTVCHYLRLTRLAFVWSYASEAVRRLKGVRSICSLS